MLVDLLKSKSYYVTVAEVDPDYKMSINYDWKLNNVAGLLEKDLVQVLNTCEQLGMYTVKGESISYNFYVYSNEASKYNAGCLFIPHTFMNQVEAMDYKPNFFIPDPNNPLNSND